MQAYMVFKTWMNTTPVIDSSHKCETFILFEMIQEYIFLQSLFLLFS